MVTNACFTTTSQSGGLGSFGVLQPPQYRAQMVQTGSVRAETATMRADQSATSVELQRLPAKNRSRTKTATALRVLAADEMQVQNGGVPPPHGIAALPIKAAATVDLRVRTTMLGRHLQRTHSPPKFRVTLVQAVIVAQVHLFNHRNGHDSMGTKVMQNRANGHPHWKLQRELQAPVMRMRLMNLPLCQILRSVHGLLCVQKK